MKYAHDRITTAVVTAAPGIQFGRANGV